jgi:hypothetical protein
MGRRSAGVQRQYSGTSSITVGVLAVLLALAIGALGNLTGAAVTGTALVWDASPLECRRCCVARSADALNSARAGVRSLGRVR